MTIPNTARKAGPLLGTGSQTAWPFTFKVFTQSDVAVSVTNALGVVTVLALGTDYTVTLNSNQDTSPGGTVNYPISGAALPVGSALAIIGDLDYDQALDLPSGGNFSPLALENQLDRATMQIQQLKELSDRSARMSVFSSPEDVEALTSGIIALAAVDEDIAALSGSAADIATVADSVGSVNTVADSIGAVNSVADNLSLWRDVTAGNDIQITNFNGTGAQVAFTLPFSPGVENNTQVFIGGVYQQKNTYSLSGTTLTFGVAPPSGTANIEVVWPRPFVLGATDAALVSFVQAGTGAVTATVQSKLRETVSVKDFGAVGDGAADDTAAIQAAINAALNGGFKRLYFPQGNYKVTSTITIPSYYNASLSPSLWGSVGQDFDLDFGHATITSSVAAGSTIFNITVGNYPQSRYFLDITGGTFYSTTAVADVFRITGGSIWMCRFIGNSVPAATAPGAFVRLYNTSGTYQPGTLLIRDVVVSADSVFTFDNTAGGLTFADNCTFDNIYHFGTSASSGTIRLLGATGFNSSRFNKIVHVGVGKVVSGTSGYLSYSTLTDLYSESTTSGVWLIDCALVKCFVSEARLYITNHSTQTTGWYAGSATGSKFHALHVNSGTAGGGVFYDTSGYAYYPIISFGGTSAGNAVSGYTQNEYQNAINGRSGAVVDVEGYSPRGVLTAHSYTAATLSTTGFTQCGKTIPNVAYLGSKFVLDIELSGTAFGAGAKVLAVECRIGSSPITVSIGSDISITAGQWKAKGRLLFNFVSGTTYNVIMSFGESWSSSTAGSNKVGTSDISPVNVNATDAISFGLNVKTMSGSGVVIGDGSIEILPRFGIYDSLA